MLVTVSDGFKVYPNYKSIKTKATLRIRRVALFFIPFFYRFSGE